MKLPKLDELSFPANEVLPVVLRSLDGEADIRFAPNPSDPGMVEIVFTYEFPNGAGTLTAPIDVEPADVERVYRLMRGVTAQAARDIVEDKLRDPELPPLRALEDVEVPRITFKPLVLEEVGRRKVLDVRAGSVVSHRREYLDKYPPSDDRTEYGYVTAVKVHRVTCTSPKVRQVREDLEQTSSWLTTSWKSGLDRRTAWFEEFLPHVARGNLVVEMCLTCKPLGQYSKWINERVPSGVLSDADRLLIAEPLSAQGIPHRAWLWMWRQWMAMTPQRWEALAELIEFLDQEVNGERGPAAGENVGDTVE